MKRISVLAIAILIIPYGISAEMGKLDRVGLSLNAIHGLLGEIQVDCSMRFDTLEFSLKPGVRIFYVQEEGNSTPGQGYSFRMSAHRYITPSLYFGVAFPAVLALDVPNPSLDIDYAINLGVAPILGWKYKLGIFLLTAELGAGIGAQLVVFENPWFYAIKGWFPLHAELGVGLAFERKRAEEE